ncbi:hypothetical protein [Chitinophaga rhizophila]|nr:hypothetical protein [Chitinophaga rhizophila]
MKIKLSKPMAECEEHMQHQQADYGDQYTNDIALYLFSKIHINLLKNDR